MTVSDSVAGQSDQQCDGPHSQDEDNYNVKSAFGQSDQQRDGLPSLSNISKETIHELHHGCQETKSDQTSSFQVNLLRTKQHIMVETDGKRREEIISW
jgi:hypothetical protein